MFTSPRGVSRADADFAASFEDGTLPPSGFRHREHVRLAWIYLARHGRDEAGRRLLRGLQAFAARAGAPAKFDAALTLRWLDAIDQARRHAPHATTFEALVAARPDLLGPAAVKQPV